MPNNFHQRFNQGLGNVDNSEGTWQMPMGHGEDTYFTGNGTNYITHQQSSGSGSYSVLGSGHVTGGSSDSEGMSPVFSTGLSKKNIVGGSSNSYKGLGTQSQYTADSQHSENNFHFMSSKGNIQDRYVGKRTHNIQDDSDNDYYDGFPNESYMTNSGGNMVGLNSMNSGCAGVGGNSVNMGNFCGSSMNVGGNSANIGSNSMNMGNNTNSRVFGGNGLNVEHSGSLGVNGIGNCGSDNMMIGMNSGTNYMGMDSIGNFRNVHLQNQLMAAVGVKALAGWSESCGSNSRLKDNIGKFGIGNKKREKREHVLGFNRRKGPGIVFDNGTAVIGRQQNQTGGNNLTISLNATNHNQWCFLRKKFNKRDNDFVEHLFDIHEKFCHHCRERIEEKKYGKKRKYPNEHKGIDEPPVEEEVHDEEMTQEELEIKKLMGFAGFKTTKGFRVKDNNYSTISSLNALGSSDAVDETTALTEYEKKMISLRGGFSVFTKPEILQQSSPRFGAPAVTFDLVESNGTGSSNEPLVNKKINSHLKKDEIRKTD